MIQTTELCEPIDLPGQWIGKWSRLYKHLLVVKVATDPQSKSSEPLSPQLFSRKKVPVAGGLTLGFFPRHKHLWGATLKPGEEPSEQTPRTRDKEIPVYIWHIYFQSSIIRRL